MKRIILVIISVLLLINGIGILTSANCSTVSFDGEGGGRVVTALCYPDNQGALPAWLAATGMILIAITLAFFAVKPSRG